VFGHSGTAPAYRSDEEEDEEEEESPNKRPRYIPPWAMPENLETAILLQEAQSPRQIFGDVRPPDMAGT